MPLSDGESFASYTVHRLIDSGEMGDVYLAKHPDRAGLEVLRVLPESVSGDADYRARFGHDAAIAVTLEHPNIVAVRAHGEVDGRLWLASDFVDAPDAEALLSGDYPTGIPVNLVLDIVAGAAAALDDAHDHDVRHGHISSTEILLHDPGSSRKRRTLVANLGFPARGEPTDDLYALAATTYHLLTGERMPKGGTVPKLAATHHTLAPLDDVMEVAFAGGYTRVGDFADALTKAHIEQGIPPENVDPTKDVGKAPKRWTKRKTTIAVLASIGIIATLSTVLAGLAAVFFSFGQPAAVGPASTATSASPTSTVPEIVIAPLMVRPVVVGYVPTPDQCLAPPPPVPPTEVFITCDLAKTGIFTLDPTVLELQLTSVKRATMPNLSAAVQIELSEESQAAFAEFTALNTGMQVAFVRDGVIIYAPTISEAIDSPALQLAGELTAEQADQMVAMLRDGV